MKRIAIIVLAACGGSSEPTPSKTVESTPAQEAPKPAAKADDDLPTLVELAKNGPTKAKFPQADAYIALDRRDIELKPDRSVVEKHHTIVRVLDAQRGKEKFADLHIRFNKEQETIAIDTARTVNPDGSAHVASGDEIGDIVPPELSDAGAYADVRERVVTFPAVDMGSVLELEYTRTTKASPDAPLGGEVVLGAWDPIQSMVVSITGAGEKLAVTGADLKPETHGDTTTYTLADQPDRHPEMDAPPDATVLPRLVYGFSSDWHQVVEPLAAKFAAAPTPAITAAATDAVAGATTDEDKAQKLFAFVAQNIRPVDLVLGQGGYAPHAADTVLANRYADGRDKVALLLAMAASQGIHGQAVFARGSHVQIVAGVPTLAQFDRVLAKLTIGSPAGGKDVWLDPEREGAQYGVAFAGQDNLVLPITRGGELGKRPVLDPATSLSQTTAKLALSADGDLDATYDYALGGVYAIGAVDELRPLQGERLTRFFNKASARLSAAAIDKDHTVGDLTTGHGLAISQHVTVPAYSQAQANYRIVELPPATLSLARDMPDTGVAERKYPLLVGTPRTERTDVSLSVPAGWKVTYVPPPLEGAADGIKYTDKCEAAGQSVTCHTEVTIDRVEVSTAQYASFRDAFAKLRAYERRVVVLAKA